MELDPELVLQPELFVFGLQHGDEFDVSRVRSQLRGLLPAVRDAARLTRALRDKCADKPTYTLQKETGVVSKCPVYNISLINIYLLLLLHITVFRHVLSVSVTLVLLRFHCVVPYRDGVWRLLSPTSFSPLNISLAQSTAQILL